MSDKIPFLLATFLLFCSATFSQKLMHSTGISLHTVFGEVKTPSSSYSFNGTYTIFTYFPRYNLLERDNSSLSIGLPLGTGIGVETSLYGNDTRISFAYELASALDYNIGCKSTRSNLKKFGGYFGTGFSYFQVFNSIDFRGSTYGPLVRGGLRFLFSQTRMAGNALSVGLFYKKGLETVKASTIGLNALWDF